MAVSFRQTNRTLLYGPHRLTSTYEAWDGERYLGLVGHLKVLGADTWVARNTEGGWHLCSTPTRREAGQALALGAYFNSDLAWYNEGN